MLSLGHWLFEFFEKITFLNSLITIHFVIRTYNYQIGQITLLIDFHFAPFMLQFDHLDTPWSLFF